MTTETAARRPRVDPATWAQALADWRLGAATLPELADRTGLSIRGLQYRLKREGASKGESIAAESARIERATLDALTGDGEFDRIALGKTARQRAYRLACQIEDSTESILADIGADPISAARHSSSLRALNHAASLVERLWSVKAAALALKSGEDESAALPELRIVDLTADDIARLRQQQEDEDAGALLSEEEIEG